MKRLLLIMTILLQTLGTTANRVEVIYQGPKEIGDWGTLELSNILFHSLEMNDTVYVYTRQVGADAKGAFQDHDWNSLASDVMNGMPITGDFELVIDTEEKLKELQHYGLKIRGYDYVITQVAIKHNDHLVRNTIIAASILVLMALLLALGILLYKNRQLRRAYRSIYKVNLEALATANQERRIRAHYQGQIEAYKEMLKNPPQAAEAPKKYLNSTLDEDEKMAITTRIFHLFEDTEEYFAPDFNLNKLAELVGSNYKNVSQVINEHFGRNFNTLLNEYRTQEACRLLGDIEHYGNLTIEAIGESVGFGSRSTFVTTFKKLTGLSPSEYQRQAKG